MASWFKLYGELFAGASIDLVIVEAGVRGGIGATIEFDLHDINVHDGKIRVSEIIANAQEDPRCIFDITGRLYLFLEAYLNYSASELNLDCVSIAAIVEALIKGRGVLWPSLIKRDDGTLLVDSVFESVDDLLVDPDAKIISQALWIGRRRYMTLDDAAQTYRRSPEDFKARGESFGQRSLVDASPSGETARAARKTANMVEVVEIYSRIGIGDKLASGTTTFDDAQSRVLETFGALFGKQVFLAFADGIEEPLNVPKASHPASSVSFTSPPLRDRGVDELAN